MESVNFSLEQAEAMLPQLRQMLIDANSDLDKHVSLVQAAKKRYEKAETEMDEDSPGKDSGDLNKLRSLREKYQSAISDLSREQNDLVERLSHWIDRINSTGVIIRNIREGLLDFPAEKDGFAYFLCWKLDEKSITHWHLQNDGFIGRKPLVTLSEYL